MKRRHFLKSTLLASGLPILESSIAEASSPEMKISRIRYYQTPNFRPTISQSTNIVTIETNQGLTGVGEGGSRDTLEQCAAMLIGQDPSRIGHLWQMMYRGYFYPAGREKLHALGALDMALWDLKGKALGVPVFELLGGAVRDYIECYSTAFPSQGSLRATARACMEAGFRAYRTSLSGPVSGEPFDSREMIRKTFENCREIREGIGVAGAWAIDFHTRLDLSDAVYLSSLIQSLEPHFVEDLIRSENPGVYRTLRPKVQVPIAVGEQFGDRWDINELIEQHLIDYSRVTLPNCGGITEFVKLAALCETHYVGLIPHFTGPVATAALVHVLTSFPGPVMMEILGEALREEAHLPQHADFREGRLWPNRRPGLGVEFDPEEAQLLGEVNEPFTPIPMLRRPDGSFTNW